MPSPSTDAYTQAAARGADALDQHQPGWALEVDPDRLDARSPAWSVLGQLWGDASLSLTALGAPTSAADGRDGWTVRHGFDLPVGAWELLTAAWREQITQRRRPPASPEPSRVGARPLIPGRNRVAPHPPTHHHLGRSSSEPQQPTANPLGGRDRRRGRRCRLPPARPDTQPSH